MPRTKQAAQGKRRSKVVLALGAAGLSLSLGSSASAGIGGMNGVSSAPVSEQMHEGEISDVWRHSTSSTGRMPALTGSAHGWPWGSAVVPVAAAAAALVGSVCVITTHRRCLATRSIRRRFGRSARRKNLNLTARAGHNDLQLLFAKA